MSSALQSGSNIMLKPGGALAGLTMAANNYVERAGYVTGVRYAEKDRLRRMQKKDRSRLRDTLYASIIAVASWRCCKLKMAGTCYVSLSGSEPQPQPPPPRSVPSHLQFSAVLPTRYTLDQISCQHVLQFFNVNSKFASPVHPRRRTSAGQRRYKRR
jgi:hypothetical protein